MPTYEGIRLRILKIFRTGKLFAERRRKQLKDTNFTIISNNCWSGMIYESYGLPKRSPTVGCFFMAPDYIEFISDLKGYIDGTLTFIEPDKSRWKAAPQVSGDKRFGSYPIGVLSNGKEDVEIFFLHAHNEEEARDKWERRCKRINWNRILIKFNDQNGCTEKEVNQFMNLNYKNKVFFTCKHWNLNSVNNIGRGYCVIRQFPSYNSIMASYEPFGKSRYIDISALLNSL